MMVALAKASGDGQERSFGSLSLSRFGLVLAVAKFDMAVDVKLRCVLAYRCTLGADNVPRSLEMDLDQPGLERIRFMSSAEESGKQDKDLLTVKYKRAQREGPEFESLFEGIDQSVDMDISTVNFHAAPEPVVALFSFVMTTFVPPPSSTAPSPAAEKDQAMAVQEATTPSAAQKPSLIKVNVNLDGIRSERPA
jgi:vacuolar protein sorting-associated protein 13A/C